jgi:hypothetical protein
VLVFGNWLQVGDDLNHRNLAALARKFGDIFLLRMGQRNLVVVSSPPLAREVLHTQGVEFGSRTRNVVFDIFTGKGQDMVFTVYGDHWRKMRRIMTVPFFTNKVVQQYSPGWEAEAAAVVDDVRADPAAAAAGVVLRRRLQLMMYNNMYRIMFDRRFESMDDPLFLRLRELNGERSRLAQSFEYNYGDFIPILRPFLRGYLRICKEVKETRLKLFKDFFLEERKCVVPSYFCFLSAFFFHSLHYFCWIGSVQKEQEPAGFFIDKHRATLTRNQMMCSHGCPVGVSAGSWRAPRPWTTTENSIWNPPLPGDVILSTNHVSRSVQYCLI